MDSNILINKRDVTLEYNLALEAVYTLLMFCEYHLISPYNREYIEDVKKSLGYKVPSKSIDFFRKMERFSYVIPCVFAISLELEDGILYQKSNIKPEYIDMLGGESILVDCCNVINSFINKTNYLLFFKKNGERYKNFLHKYNEIVYDVVKRAEEWYDRNDLKFTIYMSQLIHPGGFNISTDNKHVRCVLGNILDHNKDIDISLTYNVYFHEISHHFIDNMVLEYWNQLEKRVNRLIGIGSAVQIVQREYICETLIRALSNHFCEREGLKINYNDFYQYPIAKELFKILRNKNISRISEEVFWMLTDSLLIRAEKEE